MSATSHTNQNAVLSSPSSPTTNTDFETSAASTSTSTSNQLNGGATERLYSLLANDHSASAESSSVANPNCPQSQVAPNGESCVGGTKRSAADKDDNDSDSCSNDINSAITSHFTPCHKRPRIGAAPIAFPTMSHDQSGCGDASSTNHHHTRSPVIGIAGSPNNVTHPNGVHKLGITPPKGTGAKKLTIKNFKAKPNLPADYYENAWHKLKDAVHAVHESRAVCSSLEELYQAVENVCDGAQSAARLYDNLRELCNEHLRSQVPDLVAGRESQLFEQSGWLKQLDACWRAHCQHMILIRSIFLYLDRTYVLQKSTVMSIWDVGLELFRTIIMCEPHIEQSTVDGLLALIKAERLGEQVDRTLVNSLVRMLGSLQVYQQMFEERFLKESAALYRDEGKKLVQDLDAPTYLRHVYRRLTEEQDRLSYYLDYTTRKPLILCVEENLIRDHIPTILDKGLHCLLVEDRRDDIRLMHDLFSRVNDGCAQLKTHFSTYIKGTGKSYVLNAEREKTLVQDLMDFKDRMDAVVQDCFNGNEKFQQAEKDAFDSFINQRANKPAELIAKFMDSKLRSGNKEATEEELDRLMDKVIVLFRFIQGKDVFEAFYKKDLAKRLLLGRSASVDAEKAMLSKLKQECGAGFTCKLEGMFKDMELSRELGMAFKESLKNQPRSLTWPHLDMTVSILTMGHWPSYPPVDVNLPGAMTEYQEVFKTFYLGKHSGRKLQWQASLGQCVLRAVFQESVVKELQVSLFQTLVLLLFNDKDEWTYSEIKTNTNIEDGELRRTLQSLACGKFRPIVKSPKGKDIGDNDKFLFNSSCNDRLYRIRISQVQMRETEEEQQATTEQVFQDRQYQIDAAVVRIMKARKSLPHNQLIGELFRQLRFPTKAGDLKKRIESLIDRDYLCRDKEDNNVYNYVA